MLIEAVQLLVDLRGGFNLPASLFCQGLVLWTQGRVSESLAVLNEAITMAQRNGDAFWWPRLPNCIGWIYRELQDFERAADYDQEGLDVGRQHAVLEAQANSLINVGVDYTHAGRHGHVLPVCREVEDIFARDAWFRWRYNIRLQAGFAERWLTEGDADKAETFAHRLRDTATEYEAWKYVALADSVLARSAITRGNLREGVTVMETALAQLRQHPCPIVTWKIESALGHAQRDLGDHDQATAACDRAAVIVREIAGQVEDEGLQATYLNSTAVRDVFAPPDRATERPRTIIIATFTHELSHDGHVLGRLRPPSAVDAGGMLDHLTVTMRDGVSAYHLPASVPASVSLCDQGNARHTYTEPDVVLHRALASGPLPCPPHHPYPLILDGPPDPVSTRLICAYDRLFFLGQDAAEHHVSTRLDQRRDDRRQADQDGAREVGDDDRDGVWSWREL